MSSPSAWPMRLPVLVTALAGFGIATSLALYQVGALSHVWEPFFGEGSHIILKESALAQSLPIPDAALGALAYLAEACLELVGGEDRWQAKPWAVLLVGAIAAGLALAAIVLIILQAAVFRAFCTFCLASAACSLAGAAFVIPEVRATIRHLREFGRVPISRRTSWH
jgi:hypothetical protein